MWDRITLAETCMSIVPSHLLSFFKLPKGVGKRLDFFRARMVWKEKDGVRKYHLVNWLDVCQPRDQGWLGITIWRLRTLACYVSGYGD